MDCMKLRKMPMFLKPLLSNNITEESLGERVMVVSRTLNMQPRHGEMRSVTVGLLGFSADKEICRKDSQITLVVREEE